MQRKLIIEEFRRLELKPISEQKDEDKFVAPPYCQTESYVYISIALGSRNKSNSERTKGGLRP
jgi:hypothetical protein